MDDAATADAGRVIPGLILVIEDEPGIVDFLDRGLRAHGFEVSAALDGITGTEKALNEDVDLVVLDMMLPGRGGLDVLSEVRTAKPSLPVIVLTARGAQLRIAAQTSTTTLKAGDLEIDLITREVRRAGQHVRLSNTEFELLVYLLRNRGHVLSREKILRAVWAYEYDPGTNVVDVYIGYLRRKLGGEDGRATIVTVRSVGYRFDGSDS